MWDQLTKTNKMRTYGYLRASTKDQDASQAKSILNEFAKTLGLKVSSWFIENESGTKLNRPELFRMLNIAEPEDALLIEQIDRITRLTEKDWNELKSILMNNRLKVISMDLPTSHNFARSDDEFQGWVLSAINSMMLDILTATARKDYLDRKKKQAQGVKKAKELGKYKGRPENMQLQQKIEILLKDGKSYSFIQSLVGCSRHTISKVSKKITN